MCGIGGLVGGRYDEAARKRVVVKMTKAMTHRGPDDVGYLHDGKVSLGMRRLAIIDLEHGAQPIFNEAGDVAVILNGEIYNYRELKSQLHDLGHQFKTDSDTEVLVHLYDRFGLKMLEHLKGMFAFCVYDRRSDRLLLARDRFGEKPLYYHWSNETLTFASEIKALLENGNVPRVMNDVALGYYLRTSLIPEPLTLFEGIKQLPSGHYLLYQNNKLTIRPYYRINYPVQNDGGPTADAETEVMSALRQAVKRQMISDVPIGCFLSGGIDSSTIAALLAELSETPIPTYHVKFEDQGYDESSMARKVAKHIGSDHHEICIPKIDFSENIFWKIIDHVGQPFRDTSAIPSFFISREISKDLKVALSGDGGDELFGGYDLFRWNERILALKKMPRGVRSSVSGIFENLSNYSGPGASLIRGSNRALRTSLLQTEDVSISLNEMFTEVQMQQLGWHPGPLNYLKEFPEASRDWSPLRRSMYYRMHHTLPGNMLVKVDRMSMANSLEVRCPFLDVDLFEASSRLPDSLLRKGSVGKIILRKIMQKRLPADLFSQPKHGFNFPLHQFQNANYNRLAERLLVPGGPLDAFFHREEIETIKRRGINQKRDEVGMSAFRSSHQLWMLMQLSGWIERFNVRINSVMA